MPDNLTAEPREARLCQFGIWEAEARDAVSMQQRSSPTNATPTLFNAAARISEPHAYHIRH